jgi:hypothetical protein
MVRRKEYAKLEFADGCHATDDALEQYAMGRLPEPQLAEFEEHLLVCESCQDRLALEDSIRQGVRDKGAALQQPHDVAWWRLPRLAWAAGLVAVGLAVFAGIEWHSVRHSPATPAVILLQTTRGTEGTTPAAPAGRPLTVVLDLTGLQQFSEYKLEIVDAAGHSVFQASRAPQVDKLQATLSRGLAAGAYFVRVYNPARELLREYALVVRG